ncbi:MAG: segregation and condensation protein [Thermoanaerobacteraceae bacterium]|jgi:segregation and condensation protein A|nr:segregation and condensation protein [Thermoanaerobacteraceae bacterium]MDN5300707.1 segregation and condensation protein [Thermoanaerobacteraceae bacterium]
MALNVKLEAFEGPFDLLFHLIEKNQIDIYDIPIAQLTDQYLEYLKDIEENKIDLASEFLVMAATLLSIKSRMLLPVPKDDQVQLELAVGDDELDPRTELVNMLVEYKKYKDIAEVLKNREEEQRKLFKRVPEDLSYLWNGEFTISNVNLENMKFIFSNLIMKKNQEGKLHTVSKDPYPLAKKVKEIYKIIASKSSVLFSKLFNKKCSKLELIVTFLAILELIKMNKIIAAQERLFDEIVVTSREVRQWK